MGRDNHNAGMHLMENYFDPDYGYIVNQVFPQKQKSRKSPSKKTSSEDLKCDRAKVSFPWQGITISRGTVHGSGPRFVFYFKHKTENGRYVVYVKRDWEDMFSRELWGKHEKPNGIELSYFLWHLSRKKRKSATNPNVSPKEKKKALPDTTMNRMEE